MKSENKQEKKLDLELLVFYLFISMITFGIFFVRHPLMLMMMDRRINTPALIMLYRIDIIMFMSAFIPYLVIIIVLIFMKLIKKTHYSDDIMIILFFPLFSFFTKSMSLMSVYDPDEIFWIIKDNFAFFSFILLGPGIVALHKIIMKLQRKDIV